MKKIMMLLFMAIMFVGSVSAASTWSLSAANQVFNNVEIEPNSANKALIIDQNYNAQSLYIDSEATSDNSLLIYGKGTGETTYIRHESGSGNGQALHIDQNSDGVGLEIDNAGTGNGLFIDQNGDGNALYIDSESTSSQAFNIAQQTGINIQLGRWQGNTEGTNWFYRNLESATTASPVVLIEQDNAGDDQAALSIQNDGTGATLQLTRHGGGIQMESPDGTIYCLTVANGGTLSIAAGVCTS